MLEHCLSWVLSVAALGAPVLPTGFTAQDIAPSGVWESITGLAFAPDGRILVIEKRGVVHIVEHGLKRPEPFLDLETETLNNGDRGLLGIALDPRFSENHRVYLLYTVDPNGDGVDDDGPAFGRLTRYTASSSNLNVADPSSRKVLIGETWTTGVPSLYNTHTIGCLRFGNDGSLLISTGDGAHAEVADAGGKDPTGFGPGRTDPIEDIGAFRSQWIGSLAGKILRVDPETADGLPTNPFYTGNPKDIASRVWAYGLRNPYRFTVRPGTGSLDPLQLHPGMLLIAEVGWRTWEEINVCNNAGANFGWPCHEGPVVEATYSTLTPSHHGCTTMGTPTNPSAPTDPIIYWHHTVPSLSSATGLVGKASTAVTFYTGTAYPSQYWGAAFFGDYERGWIRAARIDANGQLLLVSDFATDGEAPVDLMSDPVSGDLFYISILRNKIWRIRYGVSGVPPVAQAAASTTSGLAPLTVSFSSEGSNDPDGTPITFAWDFGDGAISTEANPVHTYSTPGLYSAFLLVEDRDGGQSSSVLQIEATGVNGGNHPPVARILEPADTSKYYPRAPVFLKATATDADDPLSSLSFTWEIALHHNTHVHPTWLVLTGPEVSFLPGDHDDGTGIWLEVILHVRDPAGAVDVQRVSIFPDATPLVIDNGAPGTSFVGTWTVSGGSLPYGLNSLYSKTVGHKYIYSFQLPRAGIYRVFGWWTVYSSRPTAAPYTITHALGESTVLVDQTRGADAWNYLGLYSFGSTAKVTIGVAPGGFATCADAILLLPVLSGNLPPLAHIDSITPNLTTKGTSVAFVGHGEDDGTIAATTWESNLDGVISNAPSFSTSSLRVGTHTIQFRVQDDAGVWSEAATSTVRVLDTTGGVELIVDNGGPGTSSFGVWSLSSTSGAYGGSSVFSKLASDSYFFETALPSSGIYEVYAWWTSTVNRASAAPHVIATQAGDVTVNVDQRAGGGRWNLLGTFNLPSVGKVTVRGMGGGPSTSADAVRFVKPSGETPTHLILDNGSPGTSFTGTWTSSGGASPYGGSSVYAKNLAAKYTYAFSVPAPGQYEIQAWWTTLASRSPAVSYVIAHANGTTTVAVDQRSRGGQWNSLGTFQLGATATVTIVAKADGLSYCADAVCLKKIAP
jgi:glucose/arabinose dehydrogenase/PKD repeat protein